MKAIIRRCTLALIMCGLSAAGMAQTEILNEGFSSLTLSGYNVSSLTNAGWTISNCCGTRNGGSNSSNVALKIEWSSDGKTAGSAKTPTRTYTGDAFLTFSHAYTNIDKPGKLDVTIDGGGSFEGGVNKLSFNANTYNATSFTPESIKITGFTSSTRIKFTVAVYNNNKNSIAIDDVKIVSTDGVSLLEASDNTETLTAYNGMTAHVTIRPLTGGIWNTMCLPFDVNMAAMEAALGENQDIKLRTYESYDAAKNVMNFTAVTGSIVIPAGTPFLVWLNTSVGSPKFDWVTVKNTDEQTITDNGVSFVGTYNPVNLSTDGTNLFLTKKNALAIPGAGTNQIKGMRAYISVPESMKFTANSARIAFIDEQPTAIETVESVGQQPVPATYSLSGQRVAQPKKGLYIVNGKLTLIK